MSFEDIARKISKEIDTKPKNEIADQTLDLGMVLTAKDFIEPIKKIKQLKKILEKVDSMNLYKRGWRFQLGTSKEWAGLCSAAPSSVYKSKENKNLFVSIDVVKGDDNWKDNMKSTIYHEIAHAIVREIFYYPESPSTIATLDKIDSDHRPSKGHGEIWRLVCAAIVEKGVVCTQYYKPIVENNYFKKFRYICTYCENKQYSNSKFFATRCSSCQKPIQVVTNII
jgi:predicted SprT family Zn-dependent metalloprotease